GETNPPSVDGQILNPTDSSMLPLLVLPVQVQIGGQAATVLYQGGAPGLAAGMVQINAQIPPGVPSGAHVPLTVTVGTQTSPTVYVSIQ
ncbi:MAG: hypothetical protein JO022_00260, partial [Acidobacteriaceae bacterium]|nr:hypothetical protein [Acidobacteriaceae bacterium]